MSAPQRQGIFLQYLAALGEYFEGHEDAPRFSLYKNKTKETNAGTKPRILGRAPLPLFRWKVSLPLLTQRVMLMSAGHAGHVIISSLSCSSATVMSRVSIPSKDYNHSTYLQQAFGPIGHSSDMSSTKWWLRLRKSPLVIPGSTVDGTAVHCLFVHSMSSSGSFSTVATG